MKSSFVLSDPECQRDSTKIFLHRSVASSNALRVVSKCCTAGSKRCCFDGAQCPDIIIHNTFRRIHFLSPTDNLLGRKKTSVFVFPNTQCRSFMVKIAWGTGSNTFCDSSSSIGWNKDKKQVVIMITDCYHLAEQTKIIIHLLKLTLYNRKYKD